MFKWLKHKWGYFQDWLQDKTAMNSIELGDRTCDMCGRMHNFPDTLNETLVEAPPGGINVYLLYCKDNEFCTREALHTTYETLHNDPETGSKQYPLARAARSFDNILEHEEMFL